jgi:hypothetical protein
MQKLQVFHDQPLGDLSDHRWIVYWNIVIPGPELVNPFIFNALSQNHTLPDRLLKLRIAY